MDTSSSLVTKLSRSCKLLVTREVPAALTAKLEGKHASGATAFLWVETKGRAEKLHSLRVTPKEKVQIWNLVSKRSLRYAVVAKGTDSPLCPMHQGVYSRPIERSTLVYEGGGLSKERWLRLPSRRSLCDSISGIWDYAAIGITGEVAEYPKTGSRGTMLGLQKSGCSASRIFRRALCS